jgi:glycosyltransferase involved in cell wall biosynthesis
VQLLLSVVMPAFNEEEYLPKAGRQLSGALRERSVGFEIVVCENGSTDDTISVAKRLAEEIPELRVVELPDPDYGRALRAGFLAAKGDLVVNLDVDAADVSFVDSALERMGKPDEPAIVIGSKRAHGADDTRGASRRLVSAVFSFVLHRGFGLKASDTHGPKMLRRAPLLGLVQACQFGVDIFDTELVLRAERAGMLVVELPIQVVEQRPPRSYIARRIPRTLFALAKLRVVLWRSAPIRDRPA